MVQTTSGLPALDSLLGGGLRHPSIIGLAGHPGSGKQCFAAAYAFARARCCWVSFLDGQPYLPPELANRWAEARAQERIVVVTPDLLHEADNAVCPAIEHQITLGHTSFVFLHTELLAHLASPSECVRLVYLLRRRKCEALFVAEDAGRQEVPGSRGTLLPWETLADVLLRTAPCPDDAPPHFRLTVAKPPSPEMVIPPADYTIGRSGIHFVGEKRASRNGAARATRSGTTRTVRQRTTCRVLPELYYLDASEEQYVRQRTDEINARHPSVHYQLPRAPFADSIDYNQAFERFRKGETVEDLFIIDIYRLRECIEKGLIQPLDAWVDDAWRARFLPQALQTCTHKGQLWAIPHWINAGVLIYRKDLLDKHGKEPPATFNQLVETAITVLDGEGRDRRQGFGFQGSVAEALSCCFLEFLWNHGGDVYNDSLKPLVREKPGLAALQLMHDLLHDLKISPQDTASLTETGTARLFHDDKLLFMRKWPNFLCTPEGQKSPIPPECIGMASLPTLRANMTPQAVMGAFAYVLPSQVIDPEPVLTFHSQFYDEEGVRRMALKGWGCSPYREVYEDEKVIKGRPWYANLPRILSTGRSRQDLPSYHRVTTLLREEVNLVLRRLRTPAEALDSIATRLDAQVLRQADANRLHEVIEYLKDNLHLELSREEIAARCNLNPSYFSSLFKELTGETFRRFVNRERIRKAQRLLVTSEQSAGEIARSVGFTDPSYFSQVFREYIGMTPIEHRSQARRRMGHH